jgi:AcrR family transcriptional regulator
MRATKRPVRRLTREHGGTRMEQARAVRRGPDPTGTRLRILAAARELYLEQGVAATTLSAVAERAEVSRPTVYKHVGDAASLATLIIQGEITAFFERLDEVLVDDGDVRESVRESLAFTVEYAAGHRLLQRLLELESDTVLTTFTTGAGPVLEQAVARLEPVLAAGVERGQLRPTDLRAAAEWLTRIATSLVLTPSVVADLDDPARLRAHLDVVLEGVLASPAR